MRDLHLYGVIRKCLPVNDHWREISPCEGPKARKRSSKSRKIQEGWHVAEALLEVEGDKFALQATVRSLDCI